MRAAVLSVLLTIASAIAFAQQPASSPPPSPRDAANPTPAPANGLSSEPRLDAILDSARAQLAAYLHLLPNVIGTETGRSVESRELWARREIRFTAHIRVVHAPLPQAPDRVTEQLEFLTRNGKPVRHRPKDIPFYLVDIFSNQNPQILPPADRCIRYQLLSSPPGTIRIERWIHPQSPEYAAACAANPDVNMDEKVEITLDATTMQMIALDRALQPRRDLDRGEKLAYRYEYAPQQLGEGMTLLPVRLHAELLSGDAKSRKVFDASYGNYHRYGSTATVLP